MNCYDEKLYVDVTYPVERRRVSRCARAATAGHVNHDRANSVRPGVAACNK